MKSFILTTILFYLGDHTICAQRSTLTGVQLFDQCGGTDQARTESFGLLPVIDAARKTLRQLSALRSGHTWHDFHLQEFHAEWRRDYSIPSGCQAFRQQNVVAGADIMTKIGFYTNITSPMRPPLR